MKSLSGADKPTGLDVELDSAASGGAEPGAGSLTASLPVLRQYASVLPSPGSNRAMHSAVFMVPLGLDGLAFGLPSQSDQEGEQDLLRLFGHLIDELQISHGVDLRRHVPRFGLYDFALGVQFVLQADDE